MKIIFKYLSILFFAFLTLQLSAQEEEAWENEEESWESNSNNYWEEEGEQGSKHEVSFVNHCTNRKEIRDNVKEALKPYRYCNTSTTNIAYRRFPQKIDVVVPIYFDQQHILIFSTEGIDGDVRIRVFDAPSAARKRNMLFEASNSAEKHHLFELAKGYKSSKLYVEYILPPAEKNEEGKTSKGCIVFMMGYLDEAMLEFSQKGSSNKK